MIYVLLADGFEEIEALTPVDILRRGGKEVKTIGVFGKTVTGSHGIIIKTDGTFSDVYKEKPEMVVLPGGMPGTTNLASSDEVVSLIRYAVENDIPVAAICAAPSILGEMGILSGKKAVCFPGFEGYLKGAELVDGRVVRDGNIITAKGAGAAQDFAFELLAYFDKQKAEEIKKNMQ